MVRVQGGVYDTRYMGKALMSLAPVETISSVRLADLFDQLQREGPEEPVIQMLEDASRKTGKLCVVADLMANDHRASAFVWQ